MKPRILALIPARGGSKRLPKKNTLPLGGRPLLEWTIGAAQKSEVFCSILLSTDDQLIADIGRNAGALVPWLRPSYLANDSAESVDVALHALEWFEEESGPVDGLMLLQPTSPFRTATTIQRAVKKFIQLNGRTVVSLSPSPIHPSWCFFLDNSNLKPCFDWEAVQNPSHNLSKTYILNGAIYLIRPQLLRQTKRFVDKDAFPLIMENPMEGLDIDTPFDLQMAREICKNWPGDATKMDSLDNLAE